MMHETQICSITEQKKKIDSFDEIKLVRQWSYWRRSGEYVQRRVCFVNIQSSLHENVVFSVCACLGNAAYIIFIMLNSTKHTCLICKYSFNTQIKLREHKEKKHQEDIYPCDHCKFKADSIREETNFARRKVITTHLSWKSIKSGKVQ